MAPRPARPVPSQRVQPERRLAPTVEEAPGASDDGTREEQAAGGIITLPRVLIACATLVVLLIVGGGVALLLSSAPLDRSSPTATVNGYYTALSHKNYTLAFQFMTDSRNQVGNESSDISGFQSDDATSGPIISFRIAGIQDISSTQVTVSVTVTRNPPAGSGGSAISNFTLTVTQYDGNTWLISNVSD